MDCLKVGMAVEGVEGEERVEVGVAFSRETGVKMGRQHRRQG